MLFKESLETLVETPLRIQKSLKESEMHQYQGEKELQSIEEILNSHKSMTDSEKIKISDDIIHSLLHLQSIDSKIYGSFSTLNNFLKDQIKIVHQDLKQFDEQISKSILTLKTDDIKRKEFLKSNNENETGVLPPDSVCFCRGTSNDPIIQCQSEICNIGWYHLKCIGMKNRPNEKWICRMCERSLQ
ncbi:Chromatin remodeling protein, contains PHD Zn-finger [Pseudoloma neurophilia]|uniref:Chromatin remodeling protein, contains PHD Zn-finger n=1 Tax=Pseudoloma neurophilia TaxID=146866 RepID=A0A0R0LTK4_9MICR|nr:Chromatin remodeling protein, contains PHD Zn-finger [Pseudoloma neurophilia]